MSKYLRYKLLLILMIILSVKIYAGVTNPDISAIGQVSLAYTDDSTSQSPGKPTLGLGEVELVLDAALNPYLNGTIVFSIAEQGFEIEETYASVIRGLPFGIGLKAGKYRCGFGKINPAHPHVYPFIRTPRVMDPAVAQLLPGEESFNEVGLQGSELIAVSDNFATTISIDLLQGNSFHPNTTTADFGWLARVANSFLVGDKAPSEIGISLTQGTNDPAAKTKSFVAGGDIKTKISLSPTVTTTIQGEAIYKHADHADSSHSISHENRWGFYAFTDFHIANHYNAGILYEQYQSPQDAQQIDRGIKPFVGFNLLEESTILRLTYEYFVPHRGRAVNSVELQFLFSMGPHKAHLF
jgi:hypothetical protein